MLIKFFLVIVVAIVTSIWIAKGTKNDNSRAFFVGVFYFFGLAMATLVLYDYFVSLFSKG